MIRLTAVIGFDGQGRRALTHESNAKQLYIGRDAKSDLQIPLTTVSRRHIKIVETDSVYIIEDLGSTHGSLLNGKKLSKGERKVLRDGDIIELTKARITCNLEVEKVVGAEPNESTKMIADKAVAGILGRLGEASSEGPYFRVLSGPEEGERFTLSGAGNEWAIGRSKDCDFVVNDANVSRRHAIVKKDWNGITIQDLGSKNGVLVNDLKIARPRRLKDRDEIIIGPAKLIFIDPDADLMAALSEVPGFSQDSSEFEVQQGDPSVVGAPGEGADATPGGGGGAGGEAGGDGAMEQTPGPDMEGVTPGTEDAAAGAAAPAGGVPDEYATIDPDLLKSEPRRFPFEWVIIGAVGLIILVCVFLLVIVF